MAVIWVVVPCSVVEVHQHFRGVYCLHHHQTMWHNNPEDSHLHTQHHENLKSHTVKPERRIIIK
jgi:hypothetical protein